MRAIKADRDGFTIHACQLRPESRGTVTLASRNPFDAPAIDPRYLAEENDRRTMRDSVRIVRDIVQAARARISIAAPEFAPGDHVRTDAEIDAWIRQNAETIYHPVGTVRMGADAKAPLDERAARARHRQPARHRRVSVMPTLIGGNTNAPTIMIAEKLSDLMRGKPPLPPQDAPIAEDETGGRVSRPARRVAALGALIGLFGLGAAVLAALRRHDRGRRVAARRSRGAISSTSRC